MRSRVVLVVGRDDVEGCLSLELEEGGTGNCIFDGRGGLAVGLEFADGIEEPDAFGVGVAFSLVPPLGSGGNGVVEVRSRFDDSPFLDGWLNPKLIGFRASLLGRDFVVDEGGVGALRGEL